LAIKNDQNKPRSIFGGKLPESRALKTSGKNVKIALNNFYLKLKNDEKKILIFFIIFLKNIYNNKFYSISDFDFRP
jgi:hypothetical protein